MLKHITYTFPSDTFDSQNFFKQLIGLLSELPNARLHKYGSFIITPSQPSNALPITVLSQSGTLFPQIHLGSSQELSLGVGNLRINPDVAANYEIDHTGIDQALAKQDSLGEYFELHALSQTTYRLPMSELVKRLRGHIVRIDHTGVNVPSALISGESWVQFTHNVAGQANLYKYPTTDMWPFILPAKQEEHETDITQFPAGREPKFELVYDTYSSIPTIQIDIETDLTRPQVEQLFPEPYGISFPDLADFFRTVYVQHSWPGLAIRFDIRFKCDQPGDWETGKWLVNEDGRIRQLENFTEAVKIMASTLPISNEELVRRSRK
ncbi:MAG: hypothetical protein DLM55_00535 [Acidimicrobiales bacterium]|nr:MAG: hypothetical protein DLM55_00535 [Acidimicrobiales bacterium]